jgi:hypothetical protein
MHGIDITHREVILISHCLFLFREVIYLIDDTVETKIIELHPAHETHDDITSKTRVSRLMHRSHETVLTSNAVRLG